MSASLTTPPAYRRVRAAVAPLSQPAFRWYFSARLLSWTGTAVAPVALAWGVLGLGAGVGGLGLVLAAGTAPELLFLLVGGVVADRWPRTRVLTVTNLVCAAAQLLAASLLWSGAAEVWQLAGLSAVCGTASAFSVPAGAGLVPALVPGELRPAATALLKTAQITVKVGGPALGSVVVELGSPAGVIGWDAATFVGAAVLLSRSRMPDRPARGTTEGARGQSGFLADLADGWAEFRSHRWLWALALQSSAVVPLWLMGYQLLGPVYAQRELGGVAGWGLVAAGLSGGLVTGSLLALWWQPVRVGLAACVGTLVLAMPLGVMAVGGSERVLALVAGLTGAAGAVSTVVWISALQERIPEARLSRTLSYSAFGKLVVVPFGYLLAEPVAGLLGLRATLGAAAILITVAAAVPILLPDVRGLLMSRSEAAGTDR